MNYHAATLLIAGSLGLGACGHGSAPTYTLYRTSSMDGSLRVHWGTFDAHESDPSYNKANCEMAARLLNANMQALNGGTNAESLGFWCEVGRFSDKGPIPDSFTAAFPTDI